MDPFHASRALQPYLCDMLHGTENSSAETRQRAKDLANDIGAYHVDLNMDIVIRAIIALFTTVTGSTLVSACTAVHLQKTSRCKTSKLDFACYSPTCLLNLHPGFEVRGAAYWSWAPPTSMNRFEAI